MRIGRAVGVATFTVKRAYRRLGEAALRPLFREHGRGFRFDPDGAYSFENVSVGESVSLSLRPTLMAGRSEIVIGSHVMFGPEVLIVGGGHNMGEVGRFMKDVEEKRGDEDLGVVIEDDVWIGARAMILRGVRIGRGSVVGAGTVLTKSVPPYGIAVGNPARLVKFRFDVETIIRHEEALYPAEKRLDRRYLEQVQSTKALLPPFRKAIE